MGKVCKLCNNDKVETELHFVMECSILQTLRSELFFIITETDHTFMHLNITGNSEINTKMYKLCCSFIISSPFTYTFTIIVTL